MNSPCAERDQLGARRALVEARATGGADRRQRPRDARDAQAPAHTSGPPNAASSVGPVKPRRLEGERRRDGEAVLRESRAPGAGRPRGPGSRGARASATRPSTQPGTVTARTSSWKGIATAPLARRRSGSAPEPARPEALSTSGVAPDRATAAKRSPPRPHMCGEVTAITAAAATAASTALPPRSSIATPALAARWLAAATPPPLEYSVLSLVENLREEGGRCAPRAGGRAAHPVRPDLDDAALVHHDDAVGDAAAQSPSRARRPPSSCRPPRVRASPRAPRRPSPGPGRWSARRTASASGSSPARARSRRAAADRRRAGAGMSRACPRCPTRASRRVGLLHRL